MPLPITNQNPLKSSNAAGLQLPFWGDGTHWDQPPYYQTIQSHRRYGCKTYQTADIDGDGQDELIARGPNGILVNQWNADFGQWMELVAGPPFSDALSWNNPQYYQTIQCADIDGDGAAELIARFAAGIETWKYDPKQQVWNLLYSGPAWSDGGNGWQNPVYYQTIQCADIDGDGQAELLARGYGGIISCHWDKASATWENMSATISALGDPQNWANPQYYQTIQFADIDGDGAAELIARSPGGIESWKYDANTQAWNQLADGPAWSDGNGWNNPQYYQTIQTAMVNQSRLFGSPKTAVLMGRAALCMQTWSYDPTSQQWGTMSEDFPQFTGEELVAYNYLTQFWNIQPASGGVRYHYNDESGVITNWHDDLQNNRVPIPQGADQSVWQRVYNQIQKELLWVGYVQTWYGTNMSLLINTIYLGNDLTVQTVGDYLSLPPKSEDMVVLEVLSLVFNAAWAVFGGIPGIAVAQVAGAVAGVLATACAAGAQSMPGGGSIQAAYADLQSQLDNAFNAVITGSSNNQNAITGTYDSTTDSYTPGDYGLLAAIGSMIDSTIWSWESSTDEIIPTLQRQYALSIWQALIGLKWKIGYIPRPDPPDNIPTKYLYWLNEKTPEWIQDGSPSSARGPAIESLTALFGPIQGDDVFPLGVPFSDVFLGQDGWPELTRYEIGYVG
jgi:hypothetical protein